MALTPEQMALFKKTSVPKNIKIELWEWVSKYSGRRFLTLENDSVYSESLSVTRAITTEKCLPIGCVGEGKTLKFRTIATEEIKEALYRVQDSNGHIGVEIDVDGSSEGVMSFSAELGDYSITSITINDNNKYIDVSCNDYFLTKNDEVSVSNFQLDCLSGEKKTIASIRQEFTGTVDVEGGTPANDSVIIDLSRFADTETSTCKLGNFLSRDMINSLCEISGVYFYSDFLSSRLIMLKGNEQFYPALDLYPSDDLYPIALGEDEYEDLGVNYKSLSCASTETAKTTRVSAIVNGEKIEMLNAPTTRLLNENEYVIKDNMILKYLEKSQIQTILRNLYEQVKNICYRPANITTFGDPTRLLGGIIKVRGRTTDVYTYMLSETLSGIQSLVSNIVSNGQEKYDEVAASSETSTFSSAETVKISPLTGSTADKVNQLIAWMGEINEQLKKAGQPGLTNF